jgi:hypothetical protein
MPWNTTMQIGPNTVRLLLTDENNHEILKARLPLCCPVHPRSATTLLEGLSLWAGAPLTVALGAVGRSSPTSAEWLFGSGTWPADSALVRFDLLEDRPRRRRTIAGLGDFRQLRLLHRDGRSS